jgi:hypothetical protein
MRGHVRLEYQVLPSEHDLDRETEGQNLADEAFALDDHEIFAFARADVAHELDERIGSRGDRLVLHAAGSLAAD